MTPALNAAEQGALNLFADLHICRKAPWWRRQPVRKVTCTLNPPNGIGPSFTARCSCGLTAIVADYGSW